MLLIEVLHGTTEIRWGSSLRDNYLMFFVLLCVFLVCFVVVFLATKGAKGTKKHHRCISKIILLAINYHNKQKLLSYSYN